ncbi:MAG TPA: site-2 protease family protein [Terriglobales bacterium]|nr:site-2 protease family protein [Terriglobales bacterium]
MSEPTPPLSSTYEYFRPFEVLVLPPPKRRYWLHALLLLATVFTTLVGGARLQYTFDHNLPAFSVDDDFFPLPWVVEQPQRLLLGIPFSATLLLILLTHEMGHFLYCLRNRVYATLPYFLPIPTPIGTLGAFIRIRSPIRTRAALFDIGIAGPIAGFVVAVGALVVAFLLSQPMPPAMPPSEIQFGHPLIFHLVHWAMASLGMVPASLDALHLHPVAMAAWVGMLATALNLLPGGQLDGGHIVYALWPRAHRWWTRGTALVLLPLGFLWQGWLLWAAILLVTGVRHPPVPPFPGLSRGRLLLAVLGLVILLLTFMPAPVVGHGLR